MKVVEDFESRPHKAVSSGVQRENEIQEWNEQKLAKVLLWLEWRKATREKRKKKD